MRGTKPNRGRTAEARRHWRQVRELLWSARRWGRVIDEWTGLPMTDVSPEIREARRECRAARAADRVPPATGEEGR